MQNYEALSLRILQWEDIKICVDKRWETEHFTHLKQAKTNAYFKEERFLVLEQKFEINIDSLFRLVVRK